MSSNKKTIYIILGSGGHTKQMLLLQEKFNNNKYNKTFICAKTDKISQEKARQLGEELILVSRPREAGESFYKALFKNVLLFGFIKQFFEAYRIVKNMNKVLLITAGPSTGFLIFFLAYLKGNYCVYLESWSRVRQLSLSGKLYKYFTRIFFVQWEEQVYNNNNVLYKGRLL